jgi:hypothetical protein
MGALVKAVALRGLKSHVDHLARTVPAAHYSLFKSQHKRFTDFVVNEAELDALNHTGIHKDGGHLLFDPQAKGDKWSSLVARVNVPALERNDGSSAAGLVSIKKRVYTSGDAYWVNNAGIALFKEVMIRSGGTDGPVLTDQDNYFQYRSLDAHADDPEDPHICRYKTLTELKAASRRDQEWYVPIYHNQIRPDRHAENYAMHAVMRQSTELKVLMRPISELVVNEHDTLLVPFKFGERTPITSNDIKVRFYSNFMIMSPEERGVQKDLWTSKQGMNVLFHYFYTLERPSSEQAGTLIDYQVAPNHPCNGFYMYFQPKSYINKTRVSPEGVGLVNYYDFSADHQGETLYDFDVKFNQGSFRDNKIPLSLNRASWKEMHEKNARLPWSTIYPFAYSTKIDADKPDKTVNHSNIDKINIHLRKNISDDGNLFIKFMIHNVFSYSQGFGGMQFVG